MSVRLCSSRHSVLESRQYEAVRPTVPRHTPKLRRGGPKAAMQNQSSSASLIELALIIVLIAIVVLAIMLIVGDDLRLWIVTTLQGLLGAH